MDLVCGIYKVDDFVFNRSAKAFFNVGTWVSKANVHIHELLCGKMRNECQLYCGIEGENPRILELLRRNSPYAHSSQPTLSHLAAKRVLKNAQDGTIGTSEEVSWLDSPTILDSAVKRLAQVKCLGLEQLLTSVGRFHEQMAKQLAKALQ